MNKTSPSGRVNYFDDQFLRRQDFSDEQDYQIALHRRHNITHHSWGIVTGLELALENDILVTRPGLAVDGYGRELLLAAKRQIPTGEFQRLGSNRLDVWLYYDSIAGVAAPSNYLACGNDNSNTHYRTDDKPRLVLERAGVSRINSRRPKGVSPAILDLPAQLETPNDPLVVWPIYLGRLTYVPEEQDPQKQFLIDASDRPYAGIVAEVIDHPVNSTRLEIGKLAKTSGKRMVAETMIEYIGNEKRAFAIFVPPQTASNASDSAELHIEPRFEIRVDDTNYLRGTTTLHGDLVMAKGAVQFTEANATDDEAQRKDPSIYRAVGEFGDELRIDLGDLSEGDRAFVIGFTADDGSFRASMKLQYPMVAGSNDRLPVLTIYGDLKLNGLIHAGGVIHRTLAAETLNALLASFQAGMAAAGGS